MKEILKVLVQLKGKTTPFDHLDAINAYTTDDMYCVYCEDGVFYKYPLANILQITEQYTRNETSAND